eukprot:6177782-Pleurochrysis_carterae.AAC.1
MHDKDEAPRDQTERRLKSASEVSAQHVNICGARGEMRVLQGSRLGLSGGEDAQDHLALATLELLGDRVELGHAVAPAHSRSR